MPLQTFINLNQDRKDEILKAAYEEFAFNSYQMASVSNIVKKIEVAKGSFYRYFENKTDLYSYLIKNAYDLRMDQLEDLLENKSYGFFEIVRENFRNKILFDIKHPLESIFLYNVSLEDNTEEVIPFITKLQKDVIKFTSDLVIQFQQKGELNPAISPELAAHYIYQSQLGIYSYLSMFKGVDYRQSIKKGHLFVLSEEEIMDTVDKLLAILKSGIKF